MANPQSWNRYSYVQNNPILFNDPTGHKLEIGDGTADYYCNDPKYCKDGDFKFDPYINRGSGGGGNGDDQTPSRPGNIYIDITIPNDLVGDLGESNPNDPSIPQLEAYLELYEFPYFGLKDTANRKWVDYAKNLPANARLSLIYYYDKDRFRLGNLSVYNYAGYDIVISNIFVYTEPLGNLYSPLQVNQDDIRGAVLDPNTSVSTPVNVSTDLSVDTGHPIIQESGLYNWETAYVSIYIAATTNYIRQIEFVIPGSATRNSPSVR